MRCRKAQRDGRAVVGRSVIDEQQLPAIVGLRENAFDGFLKETAGVQKRRDD
jgi:hypothetical protein